MSRTRIYVTVAIIGLLAAFASFWANVWWYRFMVWFNS